MHHVVSSLLSVSGPTTRSDKTKISDRSPEIWGCPALQRSVHLEDCFPVGSYLCTDWSQFNFNGAFRSRFETSLKWKATLLTQPHLYQKMSRGKSAWKHKTRLLCMFQPFRRFSSSPLSFPEKSVRNHMISWLRRGHLCNIVADIFTLDGVLSVGNKTFPLVLQVNCSIIVVLQIMKYLRTCSGVVLASLTLYICTIVPNSKPWATISTVGCIVILTQSPD